MPHPNKPRASRPNTPRKGGGGGSPNQSIITPQQLTEVQSGANLQSREPITQSRESFGGARSGRSGRGGGVNQSRITPEQLDQVQSQSNQNLLERFAGFLPESVIRSWITGEPRQPTTLNPLDFVPGVGGVVAATKQAGKVVGGKILTNAFVKKKFAEAAAKKAARGEVPIIPGVKIKLPKDTAELIVRHVGTKKLSDTWIGKLAIAAGLSIGAVSIIKDILGTYPFSGFIDQEAIQQTEFGFKLAYDSGNYDLAQQSIDFTRESLDEGFWNTTVSKIPIINTVESLQRYRDGVSLKVEINQKVLDDTLMSIENGESETDKWIRVRIEDLQREKEIALIHVQEQESIAEIIKQSREEERAATIEATKAQHKIQTEYWQRVHDENAQRREAERQAEADFQDAYWAAVFERRNDTQRSNLDFGLL